MIHKVESQTFLKKWIDAIKEEERIDIKTYGRTKEFTNVILKNCGDKECVMQKVCNCLYHNKENNPNIANVTMKEYPEYFKIDYTVWDNYRLSENKIKFDEFNLNRHCSRMILAMEHENSAKDWTDEFAKLFSVHCDLRVVVGYYDYSKLDREEKKWDEFLNFLKDITLKMIPNTEKFYGEYLLILGRPKEQLAPKSNSEKIADGYIGIQLVIDEKQSCHWERLHLVNNSDM